MHIHVGDFEHSQKNSSLKQMNTASSLIKASSVSLIIIFLAYALNYALNSVLARWLDASIYGDYSAAVYALKIASMLFLLGMDYAVIRFIPDYIETADWSAASGYMRHSFNLLVHTGIAVFACGIVAGSSLYVLHETGSFTFEQHHPVFLFFWAIPFLALNVYFGKLLRGTRHVYLSLISLNIAQPSMFFLVLSIMLLVGYQFSANEAIFGFIISSILVLLWQTVCIYKALPSQITQSKPRYEAKLWRNVALQLLITSFLTTNLTSLTVIISEVFDTHEKNTGLLSAIFTVCSSLWLTYSAASTVMSPLISPAARRNDKQKLQTIINIGMATMTSAGGILLIVIVLFGDRILNHFGPSFVLGYPALVVAAAVFVFALMNAMSLPILQYSGNQKIIIKMSVVGTIVLVVLGGLMSHFFGLMGSILSVCAVQVMMSVWCSFWVKKLFDVRPYIIF